MAVNYEQLMQQANQKMAEERVHMKQWLQLLIQHYINMPPEVVPKLLPIPGGTPEELMPSIFVTGPIDVEAYNKEAATLQAIVDRMNQVITEYNGEEARKCLSS